MGKYPRRVMLYNRQKHIQLFEFGTPKDEKDVLDTGNWIENPAEWNDPIQAKPEKVVEEEVKEEPKRHIPRFNERSIEFACDKCDFLGKNTQSLSTHKRHMHKED